MPAGVTFGEIFLHVHHAGLSWVFDDLSPREFVKELLLSHAHIGLHLKV